MLVLLFVVCSNVIQAQVGERRNDLSVGVNAGMTMTQMTFEPKIKQNMKNLCVLHRVHFAVVCA